MLQDTWLTKESIMETVDRSESSVYLDFYCNLYLDIAEMLRIPPKESRYDLTCVRSRVDSEGLSFITKVLPSLGKALDNALHSDEPVTVPTTFKKEKGRTTPNLFRSLFSRVIGLDGKVLPPHSVDTECLRGLRQLLFFEYKLEIPHTEVQERKLLDEFVRVDEDLVRDLNPQVEILSTTRRIAKSVFECFDENDIWPRHGPGAVSTGEKSWQKHNFSRLYESVEKKYPFTEYFQFSLSAVCDGYRRYEKLEVLESGIAKVVLVPKDSRGPRIISCEPLELQWIQQGLGKRIVSHLESHWCTKGHVNFTDQSINQRLALLSSTTQEWVTLDMKEASDRVSVWLVAEVFRDCPGLLEALMATRSTHTELPSGRRVQLNKFAPMGSCLCFPVEAFVFFALGVACVIHADEFAYDKSKDWSHVRPFHTVLRDARKHVYVYGDDIIVSTKFYQYLLQHFPSMKLRFNESKCCISGFFRESCGVDAYYGVNVTPLRLKKRWCHRTVDANTIVSYVEFSNLAYARSYRRVAALAARLVEEKIGPLPLVNEDRGFLAFRRPVSSYQIPDSVKKRFNKDLQRMEFRLWFNRPVQVRTGTDSWCMMLRHLAPKLGFTQPRVQVSEQATSPGVFAVPRRSCLIRGWSSIG